MVAPAKPETEIDWSTFPESDGKPMAETYPNVLQMVDLLQALPALFARQGRAGTTVGANQFVYYNPANGRDNISPDVYVAFNRPLAPPSKWQTWVEGGFPDIVFEITSPSTQRQDLSLSSKGKRALYARLGAREYYVYDPQGEMDPVVQGFERRGDRLEPLPPTANGGVYSPLMRAELRPVAMEASGIRLAGVWLRVIDPATGQPIPLAEEEHNSLQEERLAHATAERARLVAELHANEEERARLVAERRADEEEQARLAAERRADEEEQARLAAERRADEEEQARLFVEEELYTLRAALAQRRTPDPNIEAHAEGQEG